MLPVRRRSVISVRISRLSTYIVSGCSPAMGVSRVWPFSSMAATLNVDGRAASVSVGR
jgi:hypothetical protein